jgi:hypothetical protein
MTSKEGHRGAEVLEWIRLFVKGTFHNTAGGALVKEAHDANDMVLLLLFGDLLGIPNPASYYMLELLPLVAGELEGWERRMQNRRSIMAEKMGQFDFCC